MDACYRNFHFKKRTVPFSVNINVRESLFNSCVIDLLLYCSHCWSPSFATLKKLFSMQRMCLSWVTGLHDYHQQVQICNILPISFEIMRRDTMLFYKLFNGIYDLQFYDFFTVSAERRRIYVKPTYKFKKLQFNSTFTERTARLMNVFLNLSKAKLTDCQSLFKTNIESFLFASHFVETISVEKTCTWIISFNCPNCQCGVLVLFLI